MNQTANERRIALEGAVNFRDIGGYSAAGGRTVRWRRVFRSDSLSELTDADHAVMKPLAVRTVVDFRLESERKVLPNRLAPNHAIETVEIGFITDGTLDMLRAVSDGALRPDEIEREFVNQYRRFVTDHAGEFRRALSIALDERRLPLIIHCTSGKDRTGFAIATLLLALGTPEAEILADYTLTNAYMRDISPFFKPTAPPELVRHVKTAQPLYLQTAFAQMRESFGSIDAYLERALGMDDDRRAQLVAALTDPAP